MGEKPTTVNHAGQVVNTIIRTGENAGIDAVEVMIISAQPWLGFPVIKQIWEYAFGYLAGFFVRASQNGATFVVIDIQVENEKKGLSKALADVIAAEKTGDPLEIQKAIAAYQIAQSSLVHSDGSATAG